MSTNPPKTPNGLSLLLNAKPLFLIVFLILTFIRVIDTTFFIAQLYIIISGTLALLYFFSSVFSSVYPPQTESEKNAKDSFQLNSKNFDTTPLSGLSLFIEKVFPNLAGISASITVLFFLFKLMFWPGAGPMGMVGITALSATCIVGWFFYSNSDNETQKETLKKELIGLSVLCIAGIILFNTSTKELHTQIYKDPKRTALYLNWQNDIQNDSLKKEYFNYTRSKK